MTEESFVPLPSPAVLIRKKNGSLRSCVDYRRMNDVTKGMFKFARFGNTLGALAKPSQAKVLTEGGDLREAQVDVHPFGSHSCV